MRHRTVNEDFASVANMVRNTVNRHSLDGHFKGTFPLKCQLWSIFNTQSLNQMCYKSPISSGRFRAIQRTYPIIPIVIQRLIVETKISPSGIFLWFVYSKALEVRLCLQSTALATLGAGVMPPQPLLNRLFLKDVVAGSHTRR